MNRIPTEGLKQLEGMNTAVRAFGLNEQNPDRGIETWSIAPPRAAGLCLNEQNPDRGIETKVYGAFTVTSPRA